MHMTFPKWRSSKYKFAFSTTISKDYEFNLLSILSSLKMFSKVNNKFGGLFSF